jgi:acetolactate decarboxylase
VVNDALVQFSLLSALAADDYDGTATLGEVLQAGDFGVGTFDRLDGEMIVLDGRLYQALANGTIRSPSLTETTPFAAVKIFAPDGHIAALSAASLDDLDHQLDAKLPNRNTPCAIRIDGNLRALTLRSVPAQTPPYRPLVDVVKHQTTFQHDNVRGTLLGIRCPRWMGTLNVAGYHWHFLSDDRKIGGHVLGCEFSNGKLEFDECTSVLIRLPSNDKFQEFDETLVTQDDVDQIERQRTD